MVAVVNLLLSKGHSHGESYLLIQVLEVEEVRLLLLDSVQPCNHDRGTP